MTIRHYEIHRELIKITHEAFNKAVRYKAFNNATDKFITEERKQEMLQEQKRFIIALREEMKSDGVYPDLAEYQNKKMTILPSNIKDNEYLLVFFDKEVDEYASTKLRYDEEKDLLYLEEDEEKIE